jgi:hypothetical protein
MSARLAVLALALVGCGGRPAGAPPPALAARGEVFHGVLAPARATDLHAPDSTIRLATGTTAWSSLALVELAANGQEVRAGDVVARFEFTMAWARQTLDDQLAHARAEAQQTRLRDRERLEELAYEVERRRLGATAAALELRAAASLAPRQAAALEVAHRLAALEDEAAGQRLEAARRAAATGERALAAGVREKQEARGRYDFYVERFAVRAPHDGIVRPAFNTQAQRELRKGDAVMSGARVVWIARDEALVARFFIPEHRAHLVREGAPVRVSPLDDARAHPATIRTVAFFPRELAFLLERPATPDGLEKAIEVSAAFARPAPGLSSGTEVRVEVGVP